MRPKGRGSQKRRGMILSDRDKRAVNKMTLLFPLSRHVEKPIMVMQLPACHREYWDVLSVKRLT